MLPRWYSFLIAFPVIVSFLFWSSCRLEMDYDTASKLLKFSRDTLFLDTVFNQIRTETYAVKVFNDEGKNVKIPRIYLDGGATSYFKINVDGVSGHDFYDVPLRKNDSLYVFIEMAPENIPHSSIAEDFITFQTLAGTQKVRLFSLVEDAELIKPPGSSTTYEINSPTTWTSTRPKVVFGELRIKNGASLTVNSGTKVYFHKRSKLTVEGGASLQINGALHDEVIFRGDRHETRYDTLPANWDKIHLLENAIANVNYARVVGGMMGFHLEDNASLTIQNSRIFNQLSLGIYSQGGNIIARNLVTNNTGESALLLEYGGNYDFRHCTLANYWDLNMAPALSLYLSNFKVVNNVQQFKNLNAYFGNCIFYGRPRNAIAFQSSTSALFNYSFVRNLIRNENTTLFNPASDPNFVNSIFNSPPQFLDTRYSRNFLDLQAASPAKSAGDLTIASGVPLDILGNNRTTNPSIGAFQ